MAPKKVTTPVRPKILVNVWVPLLESVNEKTGAACLQRDAYLDRVFRYEAEALDRELAPLEINSPNARAHLGEHLKHLNRKPVSLALSSETIKLINQVCDRHNIIRDSFINRVLFFLVAPLDVFRLLLDFEFEDYWHDEVLGESLGEFTYDFLGGNLRALKRVVLEDPFWALRKCIQAAQEDGNELAEALHKVLIRNERFDEEGVFGLNCYIDDACISSHPATKQSGRNLDDMFASLSPTKAASNDKGDSK